MIQKVKEWKHTQDIESTLDLAITLKMMDIVSDYPEYRIYFHIHRTSDLIWFTGVCKHKGWDNLDIIYTIRELLEWYARISLKISVGVIETIFKK